MRDGASSHNDISPLIIRFHTVHTFHVCGSKFEGKVFVAASFLRNTQQVLGCTSAQSKVRLQGSRDLFHGAKVAHVLAVSMRTPCCTVHKWLAFGRKKMMCNLASKAQLILIYLPQLEHSSPVHNTITMTATIAIAYYHSYVCASPISKLVVTRWYVRQIFYMGTQICPAWKEIPSPNHDPFLHLHVRFSWVVIQWTCPYVAKIYTITWKTWDQWSSWELHLVQRSTYYQVV